MSLEIWSDLPYSEKEIVTTVTQETQNTTETQETTDTQETTQTQETAGTHNTTETQEKTETQETTETQDTTETQETTETQKTAETQQTTEMKIEIRKISRILKCYRDLHGQCLIAILFFTRTFYLFRKYDVKSKFRPTPCKLREAAKKVIFLVAGQEGVGG